MLILGDVFLLHTDFAVRDSISAYYHSTATRDLFVGILCTIGVLLITYMSGQLRTLDYAFSTIAGIAVLGVVFFPTNRPDLRVGELLCGRTASPEPSGCSPTEGMFGEMQVAKIHFVFAAVFILSLAVISIVFAYRDRLKGRGMARVWIHWLCAVAIFASGVWAVAGFPLGRITSLYIAEVVAVGAFGISWFVAGEGIWLIFRRPISGDPVAATGSAC